MKQQSGCYYAYGDIVDGAVGGLFSQGHQIDAQVVCKDLEELAKDKDVKAVVVRVNSGGGSAYASEQIWHQIMELKKLKPALLVWVEWLLLVAIICQHQPTGLLLSLLQLQAL